MKREDKEFKEITELLKQACKKCELEDIIEKHFRDDSYKTKNPLDLASEIATDILNDAIKTNKEWLFSLSDKDLATLCLGGLRDYSCQDINSLLFITEWLNEPYDEKLMQRAFPYLECWEKQS